MAWLLQAVLTVECTKLQYVCVVLSHPLPYLNITCIAVAQVQSYCTLYATGSCLPSFPDATHTVILSLSCSHSSEPVRSANAVPSRLQCCLLPLIESVRHCDHQLRCWLQNFIKPGGAAAHAGHAKVGAKAGKGGAKGKRK